MKTNTPILLPLRGEIWWADLEPSILPEPGKQRPVLVLQRDSLTRGGHSTILIAPITSQPPKNDQLLLRVIIPEVYGLEKESWILCDQIRALAKIRFSRRLTSKKDDLLVDWVCRKFNDIVAFRL